VSSKINFTVLSGLEGGVALYVQGDENTLTFTKGPDAEKWLSDKTALYEPVGGGYRTAGHRNQSNLNNWMWAWVHGNDHRDFRYED